MKNRQIIKGLTNKIKEDKKKNKWRQKNYSKIRKITNKRMTEKKERKRKKGVSRKAVDRNIWSVVFFSVSRDH